MLKTVKVPDPFVPLFEKADSYVAALFKEFSRTPETGTIHLGKERYILVRGESLFVALFDQLENSFGWDSATEFLYNIARIIGKADSKAFSESRHVTEPAEKLSAGPVLFSYTGWAFVEIYPSSQPSPDENYFLQYKHPNTFESEVYKRKAQKTKDPICFFSAGYSAGWCSEAYGVEVHAREMKCIAHGDECCEFIMAPYHKLDEQAERAYGSR